MKISALCTLFMGDIALMMLIVRLGELAKNGLSSRKLTGGEEENCFAKD